MGIQTDAGEVLVYFYKMYLESKQVNTQMLIDETKWPGNKLDRAVKYLKDIEALNIILTMGNVDGLQNFILTGLTPIGINIVENKKQFEHTFGFEVNLALFKFSWSKTTK
jgi:hypothetical protein